MDFLARCFFIYPVGEADLNNIKEDIFNRNLKFINNPIYRAKLKQRAKLNNISRGSKS